MDKTILIDGDGLMYHSSKDEIEESIKLLDEKIANIFNVLKGDNYIIFLSDLPYFRHVIYPEYKGQRRKYKSPLKWLKTLKAYMRENYNTFTMKDVEADDLCAYMYYKLKKVKQDVVMCSPDKDLLNSIPGKHFNYRYYKTKDDKLIKGDFKHTILSEATRFFWWQMLVGDSSDNVKGVEGVGPKGADITLKHTEDKDQYMHKVLNAYTQRYGTVKGVYEFQKNFRVLYMLSTDEDFLREVGKTVPLLEFADIPKIVPKNPKGF